MSESYSPIPASDEAPATPSPMSATYGADPVVSEDVAPVHQAVIDDQLAAQFAAAGVTPDPAPVDAERARLEAAGLQIDEDPSWDQTRPLTHDDIEVPLVGDEEPALTPISGLDAAQRLLLDNPTIQINGQDVEISFDMLGLYLLEKEFGGLGPALREIQAGAVALDNPLAGSSTTLTTTLLRVLRSACSRTVIPTAGGNSKQIRNADLEDLAVALGSTNFVQLIGSVAGALMRSMGVDPGGQEQATSEGTGSAEGNAPSPSGSTSPGAAGTTTQSTNSTGQTTSSGA